MSSAWDKLGSWNGRQRGEFLTAYKQSGRQYCNSGREYSTEGNRNSARLVSGLGEIVEQLATYIPQVIQELLPRFNERRTGLA